jgi:arsenate reductase (thioredoxin)
MKYVLFGCTHDAGRSQMAQAFFERDCQHDCRAESAGSDPGRRVWPEVVEVMREVGLDISGRKPKRLSVEMRLHADWAVTMGCGDIHEIQSDTTAHQWRLAKLLPGLDEEFGATRPPEVIRGCADRVLEQYDDVVIRSHILTLAIKQARGCLRQERCALLKGTGETTTS